MLRMTSGLLAARCFRVELELLVSPCGGNSTVLRAICSGKDHEAARHRNAPLQSGLTVATVLRRECCWQPSHQVTKHANANGLDIPDFRQGLEAALRRPTQGRRTCNLTKGSEATAEGLFSHVCALVPLIRFRGQQASAPGYVDADGSCTQHLHFTSKAETSCSNEAHVFSLVPSPTL